MLQFSAIPKRHDSTKACHRAIWCLVPHGGGCGSQLVALHPLPPCQPHCGGGAQPVCFVCVHPLSELQSPLLHMRRALGHAGGTRSLATGIFCYCSDLLSLVVRDGNKEMPLTQFGCFPGRRNEQHSPGRLGCLTPSRSCVQGA